MKQRIDESLALAWLRMQPYVAADRLAVIGFSMGGIATHGFPVPGPDVLRPADPLRSKRGRRFREKDGSLPCAISRVDSLEMNPAQRSPRVRAMTIASVRFFASSRESMPVMWNLTVRSAMPRRSAIMRFDSPSPR